MRREYYSSRTGKITETKEMTLKVLKKLFLIAYEKLLESGYFQKYFGYWCVDQDEVHGELGRDIESMIFLSLRKEELWPIREKLDSYSEDDLFDMIEFLHDHCSKPIDGYYHQYNNCGYHYDTFNDLDGQKFYRTTINTILGGYGNGFELSEDGEILELPDSNISSLLEADIPSNDENNVTNKISLAVLKFRRHKSTLEDRKDSIRELADVLEFLRPKIKTVLDGKDEKDLFNIANNFGVRHHNNQQKVEYDKPM